MNLLHFESNRAKIINYLNKNQAYNQLLIEIHKILPKLSKETIEIKIDKTGTARLDHVKDKDILSLIINGKIVFTSIINSSIKNIVSEELFELEDSDIRHFHFNFLVSDFCLEYIKRVLISEAIYFGR